MHNSKMDGNKAYGDFPVCGESKNGLCILIYDHNDYPSHQYANDTLSVNAF